MPRLIPAKWAMILGAPIGAVLLLALIPRVRPDLGLSATAVSLLIGTLFGAFVGFLLRDTDRWARRRAKKRRSPGIRKEDSDADKP